MIESFTGSTTIGMMMKKGQDISVTFRELCIRCMAISGNKTEFDEVTEKVIFKYVVENLSNFTFLEIEKAFYFNSIGELSQRHKPFDLFDVAFFSTVIQDWIALKSKTRQRMRTLLPPAPVKSMTPDEAYAGLKKYLTDHGGEFPEHYSWTLVYRYMEEMLMIPLDMEAKRQLYDDVCRHLKNKIELEILNLKDAKERTRRLEEIPEIAQVECRKILIKKYINN